MNISIEKRQEILHNAGKIHADLSSLFNKYPLRPVWFFKKPDILLPYSKELILQSIEEELADPMVGAAIRGNKTIDEWCENLKTFGIIIMTDYISTEQWLKEYGSLSKQAREIGENSYLTGK